MKNDDAAVRCQYCEQRTKLVANKSVFDVHSSSLSLSHSVSSLKVQLSLELDNSWKLDLMRILTILLERAEYQRNKSICSKLDHNPSERFSFTFQTTPLTSLFLSTQTSRKFLLKSCPPINFS